MVSTPSAIKASNTACDPEILVVLPGVDAAIFLGAVSVVSIK